MQSIKTTFRIVRWVHCGLCQCLQYNIFWHETNAAVCLSTHTHTRINAICSHSHHFRVHRKIKIKLTVNGDVMTEERFYSLQYFHVRQISIWFQKKKEKKNIKKSSFWNAAQQTGAPLLVWRPTYVYTTKRRKNNFQKYGIRTIWNEIKFSHVVCKRKLAITYFLSSAHMHNCSFSASPPFFFWLIRKNDISLHKM